MTLAEWRASAWSGVTAGDAETIMEEIRGRYPGDTLAEELFGLCPRADLLHRVCCLPSLEGMEEYTVTSDGFFLGRPVGHIGFNAFLGSPPTQVRERTAVLYGQLSAAAQLAVHLRLAAQRIPAAAVGIRTE